MKYKNYIKVDYNNGVSKYVTRISRSSFFTDDGTEAMSFGLNTAKDILYGIVANFYHAHIEIHPDFVVLCNPFKENENNETND